MRPVADSRPASGRHPVLVTGVGAASPAGLGAGELWRAAAGGKVCTGPVRRFDVSGYRTTHAAEVPGEALAALDALVPAHPSLASRFLAAAALEALSCAGLPPSGPPAGQPPPSGAARRIGVFAGTVMGTRPILDRGIRPGRLAVDGTAWAAPARLFDVLHEVVAVDGPVALAASGCAAGNDAIAMGARAIAAGEVDVALCGGADELSREVFELFSALRGLAPQTVRPFDADRLGMMPSEGAGVLVLESADSLAARGGRPMARLLAYASAADAHHMTRPRPDGAAIIATITECLRRGGRSPDDVDWVCAHGTGTPASDGVEAQAIAAAFGGTRRPVVSSVKGMFGHAQGAAAALEAVLAVQAVNHRFTPGNPTLRRPDPACHDVDLVEPGGRPGPVRSVVSCAFGFGGAVCTILVGPPTETAGP